MSVRREASATSSRSPFHPSCPDTTRASAAGSSRAPSSVSPKSTNEHNVRWIAVLASPARASQSRFASRQITPTMRSWVSTTVSARRARHSTTHTARMASRRWSAASRSPSAKWRSPCRRRRATRCAGTPSRIRSQTSKRCRYSRRSSRRPAAAELLPGSNWRSQTNRVVPLAIASDSSPSRAVRAAVSRRLAILSSTRRSAATSASAHSRSTVVVAGSTVNVRRHSPTSRRARSSFERAPSACPSSHTIRRRAVCPAQLRYP